MLPTALNHMTVARLSEAQPVDLASTLDCVAIEMRNDNLGMGNAIVSCITGVKTQNLA